MNLLENCDRKCQPMFGMKSAFEREVMDRDEAPRRVCSEEMRTFVDV